MAFQLVKLDEKTYGAYDPTSMQGRSFSSEDQAKSFFGTPTIDYGKAIAPTFDVTKVTGTNADKLVSFAPPAPTTQPVTLNVPQPTGTPQLPTPTAPATQETFLNAQTTTLPQQRKAVEDAYQKERDRIAAEKADAQANIDRLTQQEQNTITGPVNDILQPFRAKMETSERDRLQVEDNYFANQKLTDELDRLLTDGNEMMKKLREEKVPGLAGLQQSPMLMNALNNVSARVGVINAVMAARNNQISVAENLIDRSVAATTADKKDQLNYYNTLLNFFDKQRDEEGNNLINLDKEDKAFLTAQIGMLENDLQRSEASADYIKKLMIDPSTATLVAESGVTLNDSPEQINKKFATYIQNKETQAVQKANREAAATQKVPTQFYLKSDGTVGMTGTGYDFTSEDDFKQKTGMTVQDAQAKGMITKLTAPVDLKQYPASYQEYYLAVQQGYKKSYNEWLTEDANRKATRITYNQQTTIQADQDAKDAAALLVSKAGTDQFVSPDDYKKAKNTWVLLGHEANDFDTRFSNFVNPANPQDYGVKWKVSPPSAFEQWLVQQNQ